MLKSPNTLSSPMPMKNKISKLAGLVVLALGLVSCFFPVVGQDQKEKSKPRIGLISTQINGDSVLLESSVKVKTDGWQPVDFVWVKFDVRNDSITIPLGKALTSDKGIASIKVAMNQLVKSADGSWMFGSVFEGTDSVREGEAEVSAIEARMDLTGEKQDSTCSLTLKLFVPGAENLPITDAEVGFFVKRHFSNLKIGEGTTDENGEVTIECPNNIPGDIKGNITLIGKAEDLEEYGSVAAVMTKPWGVPLPDSDNKVTRALWSHSPPLWMVIVFAILMTTVWGHYFVIIYKLVKLRKPKIQNP